MARVAFRAVTEAHPYALIQALDEEVVRARPRSVPQPEGMLRKNITITPEEAKFLERHPEINQSALFRQVVESLMLAERTPSAGSAQPLRLGKAVYRSGAIMFSKAPENRD